MFILLSIVILVISALLFRRVAGSLSPTRINMVSWIFYFELVAQSCIGSILVINGWDNHYILGRVEGEARLYGWMAVQYTMVAMPLGMLLAVRLHGLRSTRPLFRDYVARSMRPAMSRRDSFVRIPLYLLSLASLFAVMHTFLALGEVPLLTAITTGDALSLAVTRIDASLGFSGNIYVRNILGVALTPVLTFVAFGYLKQTRSLRDRIWFYTMLAASLFILTYDLSKAPVVHFALGFLFLRVLYGGKVSKSVLLGFGGLALLILLAGYWLVMKVADPAVLFSYNTGIGGRVLLSQIAGTFFAFEQFPASHPFIGFASLSSFISEALGVADSDRAAVVMAKIFNPAGADEGAAVVMNSLFIAEAWANFGLAGVLIAPVYVGVFIQTLFLFFLRSNKTPVLLGVYAYLSLRLPVTGGFNDFIYSPGLVSVALIIATVYIAAITLKVANRKSRIHQINVAHH